MTSRKLPSSLRKLRFEMELIVRRFAENHFYISFVLHAKNFNPNCLRKHLNFLKMFFLSNFISQDQTPTPAKSKRTKKRRVREFVESPSTQAATTAFVPHRQIPISGTINLSPEKNQVFTSPSKKAQVAPSHKAIPVSSKSIAKMPEVVRNIVVSKSSVKQNPKQVIDKVSAENVPQTCAEEDMGNISSFLLGLEDLLSDEEQDKMSDDDDFLDISLLRKSRTQSKKSSRNPAPKTGVATTITSVSVPKTLMTTHSVVGQCDTSVDLFGDSLNESAIEAACQKINCAPLNPTKINCAPLNPPKTNRISSQFDIDVDFLLPVHEELSCSINQLAGLSVHTKPCSVPNLQRLRNAHSRKENNPNTHSRSKFDDCLIFVRTRVTLFHIISFFLVSIIMFVIMYNILQICSMLIAILRIAPYLI